LTVGRPSLDPVT